MASQAQTQLQLVELLQRYGIGSRRCRKVSRNELKQWEPYDVEAVLRQVDFSGPRGKHPCGPDCNQYRGMGIGLKTLAASLLGLGLAITLPVVVVRSFRNFLRQWKLSVFAESWRQSPAPLLISIWGTMDSFVKAPLNLVDLSVARKAALCVNRSGTFQVMSSGYAVMSHVWEETMGWMSPSGFGKVELSLRKKGIPRAHFLKFFDKCNSTWLWVDVLAMPEVLEDMEETERAQIESLRVGVINNLDAIYRQADRVIVLDSLTMRLKSGSLLDVAVTLSLGRWIERMWTVAEAKLGSTVYIKTADGRADLDEIVSFLQEMTTDRNHRYYGLTERFSKLRQWKPSYVKPFRLSDLVEAYRDTYTECPIDAVRAVYPILGLSWQQGWTQQDGMTNLVNELGNESTVLASLCGERGLPAPYSWTPIGLGNTRGHLSPSLRLGDAGDGVEGVEGTWKTAGVLGVDSANGAGTRASPMSLRVTIRREDAPVMLSTEILMSQGFRELEQQVKEGLVWLIFPPAADHMYNFLFAITDEKITVGQEGRGRVLGRVLGCGIITMAQGDFSSLYQDAIWVLR